MKTDEQLLTEAYKSTQWAANMLSNACTHGFDKARREDCVNILNLLRQGTSEMQEVVNRLSGMKPPKEG
jgi:hypothetical protein